MINRTINFNYALLLITIILVCAPHNSFAHQAREISLSTVPASVYKIGDTKRSQTESWYFNLVIADMGKRDDIRPLSLVMEVLSGKSVMQTINLNTATLEKIRQTSFKVTPATHPLSLKRIFSVDEAFDFRLGFPAIPLDWKCDSVRITIVLDVPKTGKVTKTLNIPLSTYSQKTNLIFPVKGRGIISQGQINNQGHSGYANQFAIDLMGLGSKYELFGQTGEGNSWFTGWGREVIAPADGKVVYARNDVPDNPRNGNPEEIFGKVSEPLLATAGNCVIIDHGNSEYSAVMHMIQESVRVKVGDKVIRGQAIGKLGNSGDSFGPHLHYQLQDGPELFKARSLPVEFENLKDTELVRGVYFNVE